LRTPTEVADVGGHETDGEARSFRLVAGELDLALADVYADGACAQDSPRERLLACRAHEVEQPHAEDISDRFSHLSIEAHAALSEERRVPSALVRSRANISYLVPRSPVAARMARPFIRHSRKTTSGVTESSKLEPRRLKSAGAAAPIGVLLTTPLDGQTGERRCEGRERPITTDRSSSRYPI
jgi:hypothetical protein